MLGFAYCVAVEPLQFQEGVRADCTKYHTVVSGDTCSDITDNEGMTLAQFFAWNPPVGTDCSALWLGYSYCVAAPLQFQSGIPTGCSKYHTVVSGDGCFDIAATYGIALSQFYAWNPPVGTDCSGLWLDYSYCVQGGPV
jgi:LysM repeat protein